MDLLALARYGSLYGYTGPPLGCSVSAFNHEITTSSVASVLKRALPRLPNVAHWHGRVLGGYDGGGESVVSCLWRLKRMLVPLGRDVAGLDIPAVYFPA